MLRNDNCRCSSLHGMVSNSSISPEKRHYRHQVFFNTKKLFLTTATIWITLSKKREPERKSQEIKRVLQ